MIVNGEHGVGVGELMEMDAYFRAGRGTSGPRGYGVVMVSGRSRLLLLRVRVGAWTFLSQERALRVEPARTLSGVNANWVVYVSFGTVTHAF